MSSKQVLCCQVELLDECGPQVRGPSVVGIAGRGQSSCRLVKAVLYWDRDTGIVRGQTLRFVDELVQERRILRQSKGIAGTFKIVGNSVSATYYELRFYLPGKSQARHELAVKRIVKGRGCCRLPPQSPDTG